MARYHTCVCKYGLGISTLDEGGEDIGFSEWRCRGFVKVLGYSRREERDSSPGTGPLPCEWIDIGLVYELLWST